MAFKELADLDCDSTTALGGVNKKTNKKNPTSAEGYYIGSKQVDSPKSKTGKAWLHIFQTAEGKLGVWGKTDLDRKVLSVSPGTMTRITFTGMQQTKNNPMYKFQVAVDDENTIEVNLASPAPPTEVEDTGYQASSNDGYEPESDVDEEEPSEPAPVRAQAARKPLAQAPSAASQARVNGLLGRK